MSLICFIVLEFLNDSHYHAYAVPGCLLQKARKILGRLAVRAVGDRPHDRERNLVDEAEEALARVSRTDIPYYIFVDELEAYYGDSNVFLRDLYMIRDLIFTIKQR